ncbi:hypothetical protein [Treponema denticola]|uniref:Lipoprotein n=1 Tax=Treponema denticola SP33 TaxID=999437 RepID=M2BEJ1_TREDN|nr:hypothetical protein [Treponema denticola]EMB20023.1 hypothetical protein HMPREF9733_02579 [Treponema denticola SP33]EPF36150.1 hypothetical protein HMPREF9732_01863 [Treponema denticola SP32]
MKKIIFLAGIILTLLGGCNMNGAGIKEEGQNMGWLTPIPEGTTWENIKEPTEGVQPIADEFSSAMWTMPTEISNKRYQIRFNAENNICKIYRHVGGSDEWFYDKSCFRKHEDGKIIFDFKPYIDYAESYSMNTCWIESYAMFKEYYEYSKRKFETATDPEIKKEAKKDMDDFYKAMKQCETFESFKKMEKVGEWFQHYKNVHNKEAAALKTINPITAVLSSGKNSLTLKMVVINVDWETGTADNAENVVFTRE